MKTRSSLYFIIILHSYKRIYVLFTYWCTLVTNISLPFIFWIIANEYPKCVKLKNQLFTRWTYGVSCMNIHIQLLNIPIKCCLGKQSYPWCMFCSNGKETWLSSKDCQSTHYFPRIGNKHRHFMTTVSYLLGDNKCSRQQIN